MSREPIPQDVACVGHLAAIVGNEPDTSYIEIRPLDPPGRQRWIPVRKLELAAVVITELAPRHQVYVAAAPRTRQSGKAEAVERIWCLWTDCDSPKSVERLRAFSPLPSVVIRSGSAGHLHAWWPLRAPLTPGQAVRANRRLALALGADRAATDAARVMRPIGSLNHKTKPPAPVECVRWELDTFNLADVVGGLADDPVYLQPPPTIPSRENVNGNSALEGLARVVREAPQGERNVKLNWAAFCAGQHVADGHLDPDEAEAELLAAALQAGLDERGALRTIVSGLGAGERLAA